MSSIGFGFFYWGLYSFWVSDTCQYPVSSLFMHTCIMHGSICCPHDFDCRRSKCVWRERRPVTFPAVGRKQLCQCDWHTGFVCVCVQVISCSLSKAFHHSYSTASVHSVFPQGWMDEHTHILSNSRVLACLSWFNCLNTLRLIYTCMYS